MSDLIWENAVLKEAVKNLWKCHQYSLVYQSFLLGTFSEVEFKAIAALFASEFKQESETQLTYATTFLLHFLNERLTSHDLSVLLNVDPAAIEKVFAGPAYARKSSV